MVNKNKYKAVILFLANKINNSTLGRVKMMKLLYYLDFDFFEKHGKSITGDVYLRKPLGPVPKMADDIMNEMVKDGTIRIKRERMKGKLKDKQLIIALKDKETKNFTAEEVEMLGEICEKWEKFTGWEMKTASHGEAPWIATKPDSVIDYNLVYYRNKYNEMNSM